MYAAGVHFESTQVHFLSIYFFLHILKENYEAGGVLVFIFLHHEIFYDM